MMMGGRAAVREPMIVVVVMRLDVFVRHSGEIAQA
jgi:hypothetical protein